MADGAVSRDEFDKLSEALLQFMKQATRVGDNQNNVNRSHREAIAELHKVIVAQQQTINQLVEAVKQLDGQSTFVPAQHVYIHGDKGGGGASDAVEIAARGLIWKENPILALLLGP